jgi:hypothetical protein
LETVNRNTAEPNKNLKLHSKNDMKDKDSFERFIEDRKPGLDNKLKPRPGLWSAIEAELDDQGQGVNIIKQPKGRSILLDLYNNWKPAAVAAAVAGVMAMAFFLGKVDGREEGRMDAFAEMEAVYLDSIKGIQKEVGKFEFVGLRIDEEFQHDIDALDSAYSGLRRTMEAGSDPAIIKEAMIENLHIRIKLLQDQLRILEGIKTQQQQHEKFI